MLGRTFFSLLLLHSLPDLPGLASDPQVIWILSILKPLESVKLEPELRQLVRLVGSARLDVTTLGQPVAIVPHRGSGATTRRPHPSRPSKTDPLLKRTKSNKGRVSYDPGNPSNHEVMQRLNHIAGLLEEIKSEGGSTNSSARSLKESFFELAMQATSPQPDPGSNLPSSTSFEHRGMEHDPRILYTASSGEHMLRWPVFNKVITEAEKHIRSFLLDSLDHKPQGLRSPRQVGIGHFVDEIPRLCKKYITLCHRRSPIVDLEHLERYAREVTIQGLGWDGPSCQVVCRIGSSESST